eukprot:5316091-Prymnesium_polylepis.1
MSAEQVSARAQSSVLSDAWRRPPRLCVRLCFILDVPCSRRCAAHDRGQEPVTKADRPGGNGEGA